MEIINNEKIVTEEEFLKMRESRSEEESYQVKMAAQNLLYQIISGERFNDFDLGEMYPALWTKLLNNVYEIMDKLSMQMSMKVEEAIANIIEEEKTNPVQKPEDRPVQNPEDKAAKHLFIDPIPVPKSMMTPFNSPTMDLINLNSEFSGDDTELEIIDRAVELTIEQIGAENIDSNTITVYLDNLSKYEKLIETISKRTISLIDIDNISNELIEITDPRFAELFIWNVFEMPEDLRQMVESMNNTISGLCKDSTDEPETYSLKEQLKTKEYKSEQDCKSMIAGVISANYVKLFEREEDLSNDTLLALMNNAIEYLTNDNKMVEAIATEYIDKNSFRRLVECLTVKLDEVVSLAGGFKADTAHHYAFTTLAMYFTK